MRRRAKRWLAAGVVLAMAVLGTTAVVLRATATAGEPRAEVTLQVFPAPYYDEGWTADERDRFREAFAARFTDPEWYRTSAIHKAAPYLPPEAADDPSGWVAERTQVRWVGPNQLVVTMHGGPNDLTVGRLDAVARNAEGTAHWVLPPRHRMDRVYRLQNAMDKLWASIDRTERLAAEATPAGRRAAFELPTLREKYREMLSEQTELKSKGRDGRPDSPVRKGTVRLITG